MTDDSSGADADSPGVGDSESDDAPVPIRNPGSSRREPDDPTVDDRSPSPFSLATARIRRDPSLLRPFAAAGILLTVIAWARRVDPLPVVGSGGGDGATISVEFAGYPTGVPETTRSLGALVDLKLPYLAWALGLEVLALLVVTVAGAVTIARALEAGDGDADERSRERTGSLSARGVLAYLGLVVLFSGAGRALGSIGPFGPIIGFAALAIAVAALVRFFAAPAFAVAGAGPVAALRRSARATRGSGWSIVALVLLYGLSAWLLAAVPYAGTFLSSALVASVHAVSVAAVRDRALENAAGTESRGTH